MNDSPSPSRLSKDKLVPILFWLAILCLFFRPLFVNDIGDLASAGAPPAVKEEPLSPLAPVAEEETPDVPILTKQEAWTHFGSDLLSFLMIAITLIYIVQGRIGSIALNTFREAVRNRILYFILFFALLLMGASGIFKQLASGEYERLVTNLGLASISFFGLMVAVFVGISLVYNEIERKTIYTIVSKPVDRYQFLLGKFFGLLLTVYVIVAIMSLFYFMVLNYHLQTAEQITTDLLIKARENAINAGLNPTEVNYSWISTKFLLLAAGKSFFYGIGNFLGFAVGQVSQNLLVIVAMTCLQLMIVTSFAILYSSFSTPTLSAFLTVATFIAGWLNEDISRLAHTIEQNALKAASLDFTAQKALLDQGIDPISQLAFGIRAKMHLLEFVSLIVPNLDSLNVSSDAIHDKVMNVWRYPVIYSLCYTGAILSLAILIFRKRNFK